MTAKSMTLSAYNGRGAGGGWESTLDWDRIRIFFTVAESGSFTKAGDGLGLSQSAVSRQIGALERELRAPLFHRHTRGLILTEQGELLFRAAREMTQRLERTRSQLAETRESPSGDLKITATRGLGGHWLTPRLAEFLDQYPEIKVELILTDDELDLSMREADIAIRLRQPSQPDLIQRRLFTVHFHTYAAPSYIKRFGEPKGIEDLDNHRILSFGGTSPSYLTGVHWLGTAGRDPKDPRPVQLVVNNITALKGAAVSGAGIAVLPDYLVEADSGLVRVLREVEMPSLDSFLAYPEEMKSVARVQVFRDFLIQKSQRWSY
jgi:DNA-binding transcriptional LysR family regulator